jgi:hypothetical protein
MPSKGNLNHFDEYNEEVKEREFWRKGGPIKLHNVVGGKFQKNIPIMRRATIIQATHKAIPWLQRFEDDWATEWVMRSLIDQRVHDRNRSAEVRKQEFPRQLTVDCSGDGKIAC